MTATSKALRELKRLKAPVQMTWEMTDAEFERYLKRNKMTGAAAASAGRKRRAAMKLYDDELRERAEAKLFREYEQEAK